MFSLHVSALLRRILPERIRHGEQCEADLCEEAPLAGNALLMLRHMKKLLRFNMLDVWMLTLAGGRLDRPKPYVFIVCYRITQPWLPICLPLAVAGATNEADLTSGGSNLPWAMALKFEAKLKDQLGPFLAFCTLRELCLAVAVQADKFFCSALFARKLVYQPTKFSELSVSASADAIKIWDSNIEIMRSLAEKKGETNRKAKHPLAEMAEDEIEIPQVAEPFKKNDRAEQQQETRKQRDEEAKRHKEAANPRGAPKSLVPHGPPNPAGRQRRRGH